MTHAKVGRYRVHFTTHALDQWWERAQRDGPVGRQEAKNRLLAALTAEGRFCSEPPAWAATSLWHRATTECYLYVGKDVVFPIVRHRAHGERTAITCMTNDREKARP